MSIRCNARILGLFSVRGTVVFNMLFAVLLAVATGIAMYVAVDEKMQTKPWRFLIPAFLFLFFAFALQSSYETLATLLAKVEPGTDHLAEIKASLPLVNNVVGAFTGALVGTAVAIRASLLNAKKLRELHTAREASQRLVHDLVRIREDLSAQDTSMSVEDQLEKHRLCSQALTQGIVDLQEIMRRQRELSP